MMNSRKSHYTDVVRAFKSNEQTVCHLLMSFIYVSYLLSVPPVPTTNQKWGARAPLCPMAPAPMDMLCTSGFMDDVIFAHKPRLLDVAA